MSIKLLSKTRPLWTSFAKTAVCTSVNGGYNIIRQYAKKGGDGDECRRAIVDIPPKVDPICPMPCERRKVKKKGILHRIKLKVIEGGTNFGTPFRRIECKKPVCKEPEEKPALLPPPKPQKVPAKLEQRPGVQVAILGADTAIGQYVAFLLKQCPCIKKIHLYEAKDNSCTECNRDICTVVQDLQHIDTNCRVQAFTCACYELERSLQNSDIVMILESDFIDASSPLEKRFFDQAPMVKRYADAIAHECPKAVILVCCSPVDCMVPLIAETLKETNWYDPRKLLGSVAVPEMRASTLAARALCLEPHYTRVPCVGGTEGDSLVPLFSKAIEYFDFARHNAQMMTDVVRKATVAVARCDGSCPRAGDLSEAHALAGLASKVAYSRLCKDIPRITAFVEVDCSQVISPSRFLATDVNLNNKGICKLHELPPMSNLEQDLMDLALGEVHNNIAMAKNWYEHYLREEFTRGQMGAMKNFNLRKSYPHVQDCLYSIN